MSENAREDHFLQNVELKKFAIRRMEITSNGTAVLCGSFATVFFIHHLGEEIFDFLGISDEVRHGIRQSHADSNAGL